jgi:hypothetical protein
MRVSKTLKMVKLTDKKPGRKPGKTCMFPKFTPYS